MRKPDRGKPGVFAQKLAVGKCRLGLLCPVRGASPVMMGDPQLMQGRFGEALTQAGIAWAMHSLH